MPVNTLQRPSITLNIVGANTIDSTIEQRVLIIGEVGNNATAETNKIIKDIQSTDTEQFGDGLLNLAIKKFKEINKLNILDVLPLDKGSAKADSTITVNGSVIKDSRLKLILDNEFIEVPLLVGDSDIDVAQKIETAFNENEDLTKLFEVDRTDNELLFTAKVETAYYNNMSFWSEDLYNSGITLDIDKFSGGVSNSMDNDLLTSLNPDERYNSIIFEYQNDTKAVTNYLEKVFNLTNEIKDGVGFTTIKDSLVNVKSIANDLNYKTLVIFSNLDEMEYNNYPLLQTAEIVAIRALRLTDRANVSKYVVESSIETFGSISFSTYPYFNTRLSFDKPKGCIIEEDLISLHKAGATTFVYNHSCVLSEVVTTYKYNSVGDDDISFKYLNYVDTMSVIREFFTVNLRKRYSQFRLTDGNLIDGYNITNIGAIKATLINFYNYLADRVITRKGFSKWFGDNLFIEDDLNTGLVIVKCKTPIVVQLRAIEGEIIEVLDIETTL